MTDRTIMTEAIGRRTVTPDLATVEVAATGGAESATGARRLAQDRAATIRESVNAVSGDRIRTDNLEIKDTAEMFESVTDAQFEATERLRINCVPDQVKQIGVEVTDAGGTVRDIRFDIHEEVRHRLQDEALTAAMDRARERADRIAAVEGLAVGAPLEVTTKDTDSGVDNLVHDTLDTDYETNLQPSPSTITEKVEVVFELTEE